MGKGNSVIVVQRRARKALVAANGYPVTHRLKLAQYNNAAREALYERYAALKEEAKQVGRIQGSVVATVGNGAVGRVRAERWSL